jgi:hypothetical protein
MPVPTDDDYRDIAAALANGRVVPFLGAGASVGLYPSAGQLARLLADAGKFPGEEGRDQLALVASYLVQVGGGTLKLNDVVRQLFNIEVANGNESLHACLAQQTAIKLIVTTNYDDLIEKALEARTPWIVVDRGIPGVVFYQGADRAWNEIESENLSKAIDRSRPIVLKLHGSLDRGDPDNDSFLLTEEQYVDFLGRPETSQLPSMLSHIMKKKAFLFLGYGLRDWNVRVLLRKLSLARPRADRIQSWAVMLEPGEATVRLLEKQDIKVLEVTLDEFVRQLRAHLPP